MIQNELEVFVDGLANCFEKFTNKRAEIGAPFLIQDVNDYLEKYTGFIRVSGVHEGSVYFTASEPLLKNLLWAMKILDCDQGKLRDLVGEISNVVSGNARAKFGDEFFISAPTFLSRQFKQPAVQESMSNYVIPIKWNHQKANLIIDLH